MFSNWIYLDNFIILVCYNNGKYFLRVYNMIGIVLILSNWFIDFFFRFYKIGVIIIFSLV